MKEDKKFSLYSKIVNKIEEIYVCSFLPTKYCVEKSHLKTGRNKVVRKRWESWDQMAKMSPTKDNWGRK